LKVSTATVRTVVSGLRSAGLGYKLVIKKILNEEKWIQTLDTIEEFINNMPRIKGGKVYSTGGYRKPLKPRTI
jgi:hypothetical protein